MTKPRVVIVGAGHAGIELTRELKQAAQVVLIDQKGFHEINWAAVRSSVEPQLGNATIIPYQEIAAVKDSFLQASVTSVSNAAVTLSTGVQHEYDYLIFSFGTDYKDKFIYTNSGSVDSRRAQFQDAHKQLDKAQSCLVIGGGPVGVELAAEVATGTKGKLVTLVTSAERLLASEPPRMGAQALSSLQSYGVQVVFGEKVEELAVPAGSFRLPISGRELHVDVAYWAVGQKACSQFLQASHPDTVDDRGFVKVNEFLQVQGHLNWFAIGDCSNLPEVKLGYQAVQQAKEVHKTLLSMFEKGPERAILTKHKPYTGMRALAVSLGKYNGAMHVAEWTLPWFMWFIPTFFKSRDLLVSMSRKELGLPAIKA